MLAIKLPLCKTYNKKLLHGWVNPYLPDRSREGGDALEDLIKHISGNLVAALNQIERETDFELLLNLPETEIREEAALLQQEIKSLRILLEGL